MFEPIVHNFIRELYASNAILPNKFHADWFKYATYLVCFKISASIALYLRNNLKLDNIQY